MTDKALPEVVCEDVEKIMAGPVSGGVLENFQKFHAANKHIYECANCRQKWDTMDTIVEDHFEKKGGKSA